MKALWVIICAALLLLTGCHGKSGKELIREFKYRTLTPEILGKLPDEELEEAVMEYIDSKINGDYEKAHEIVTALPKSFQMVYSTVQLEAEVENGGFNQYFWNSTGVFQKEALDGYKLLGDTNQAEIVAEAIRINREIAPKIKNFKDKGTVEAFSQSYKDNPLDKLDDKFYKIKASPLRVKYIREHLDQFTGK